MIYEKAEWIWITREPQPNEYVLFEEKFDFLGSKAVLSIAAETDYIVYVNGALVDFGQFAGYPFEKYCDELDLTPFCKQGENQLSITVRYEGVNSATHINDGAGVIYSLDLDGVPTVYSSAATLCGYDNRYVQHETRNITVQIGLASAMRCGTARADQPCVAVEKTRNIKKRLVKKAERLAFVSGVPIAQGSTIYDLGREEAGYLYLRVKTDRPVQVKIAYGEHLADGEVRYLIGKRDFSLDFEVAAGEHSFLQPFVRLAARYLQVIAPPEVEICSLGLYPLLYPLTEKGFALGGLDQKIYDTCVRTLRLCMHEHYEDCPWREQALYVLDSRNQMLCGYHAFEETEFQRANLVFMSKGKRADDFLELNYPAVNTPAIPFFSVMYPVAIYEYVKYTGDKSILAETMDTMLGIMRAMKARIEKNGLVAELEAPYWNFYEWTAGSRGKIYATEGSFEKKYHLILNCAFVYALSHFLPLCDMVGVRFEIDAEAIKCAIQREFFNAEKGVFFLTPDNKEQYSQLGNAFALLIGLGDERTVEAVKHDSELIPATLSMLGFVYDALLKSAPENKDYILQDIREKYGYMLSCGATSFWETIQGEQDFNKAGSLCHGWSAIPIHYYHLFFNKK